MAGEAISRAGADPVDERGFAALMAALGPFERRPRIAVAVSGGADSLALCLLAGLWARRRRGRLVGLTVDHGLRPESQAEAAQVGDWLLARGIEHHVLRWKGPRPRTGIPAAARAARYALLTGWCRGEGVLHLLLAHHIEDQGETFLLRLARGSGVDGLAAMAPVNELDGVRLLRPLLGVEKARLKATLERAGQDWIEDPSNAAPEFARTRIRARLASLAAEGITVRRLALTAARMARARAALEDATARLLVRAATIHPAGYCWLDVAALASAPEEVSLRALARVLMCVGGAVYPPRLERLERLHEWLRSGRIERARTLGGCRFAPSRGRLLVTREAAAASEEIEAKPGASYFWDGRFLIRMAPRTGRPSARGRRWIRRLDMRGWREALAVDPALRRSPVPLAARLALPALFSLEGLLAVPQLNFDKARAPGDWFSVAFRPAQPLAGSGFAGR